ncbi:MAG: guanylate kinase [Stenotrophobium sp.]
MSEPGSARGELFVLSAPSGGGKTSLARALLPRLVAAGLKAAISVSYTTRAPRPGEEDGVHYHFVSEVDFAGMIGQGAFLEHASVFGRRYGTGRQRTEAQLAAGYDVILDIDWQGSRQVKTHAPETQSIFILPPSVAELERRLRSRAQDSDAAIAERMRQAREEMAHYDEYDYLIINDRFEPALEQLLAIFVARRQRHERQIPRHSALLAALVDKKSAIR